MQTAAKCNTVQTVKSFLVGSKAKSLLPTGEKIWGETNMEISCYFDEFLIDYSYFTKRRCI
ncbi:MAG: hypothetical protein COW27_05115 [Nitrosopumilales archaeon CG15_BIG_FIL_POST_REV_8_21_14_020_37_12]|nr:MAG: hypothetical protein COW27_05115 [Nitrosopumilales archaeon CG15_BIG_FIL_POST_REV_8_21_14_020_37_12]